MALARGRFGIEYNPDRRRDDSSPIAWFVAAVLAIATVSFCCVKTASFLRGAGNAPAAAVEDGDDVPVRVPEPAQSGDEADKPLPGARNWTGGDLLSRPVQVRNLLQRLDEAEKHGRLEMAVSTIEDLRAIPAAFDLDDKLARRLGELNMRWLFGESNARWVSEIKVKKGSSASRIAFEHGSTLASLAKLNPDAEIVKVLPGEKLKVMNHPRFALSVDVAAGTADLNLNGKFFKRYDLAGTGKAKQGIATVEKDAKSLFKRLGLEFPVRDRVELDALMPKGAVVTVLAR